MNQCALFVCAKDQSSVSRSSRLILNIMTSNPIVTMMNRANPNQPNIIAVVPTPDLTLPFPRSCAIVLAATEAVCCHSTDTSTKTEATKMSASAICDTGLEGNGLTSRSDPLSSVSSCQPGKVARRIKQMKARTMATILNESKLAKAHHYKRQKGVTHIRYGKTILSLNVLATQIRFKGS